MLERNRQRQQAGSRQPTAFGEKLRMMREPTTARDVVNRVGVRGGRAPRLMSYDTRRDCGFSDVDRVESPEGVRRRFAVIDTAPSGLSVARSHFDAGNPGAMTSVQSRVGVG